MAVRYHDYKAHFVTRDGWNLDPPEVCVEGKREGGRGGGGREGGGREERREREKGGGGGGGGGD